MSTARTAIGCLAEDYTSELAMICRIYIVTKDMQTAVGYCLDSDEQRHYDVASSFVQASRVDN